MLLIPAIEHLSPFNWLFVFVVVECTFENDWDSDTFYSRPLVRVFFHYHSAVAAFVTPNGVQQRSVTTLSASTERRDFLASAAAAAASLAFVLPANAIRDYENIGLLGGGEIVDINNANVRVYLKMPGLYPSVAGKIVTNGPYKSVSDIYNIPGLTGPEKEVMRKYEGRFVTKTPSADFVIDRFNNGL
jgi:photosystem II PsbU protein